MSESTHNKKQKSGFLSGIRGKLFIAITAIMAITFFVIAISSTPVLTKVLYRQTEYLLTSTANKIINLNSNSKAYYSELHEVSSGSDLNFEITDNKGNLIYRSDSSTSSTGFTHFVNANSGDSEYAGTVLTQTLKSNDNISFEKRKAKFSGTQYLVLTQTMLNGNVLHVYSPLASIDSNIRVAVRVFTMICLLIGLLMFVFVYVYVNHFTKPLLEMNEITKGMASLDFSRKCKEYGGDEIGELGDSINTLSSTLDETLKDLKEKYRELQQELLHRQELDSARRDLINNVSHELKTPISIISGYAEGLNAGMCEDKESAAEYSAIILDESKKMNGLVTGLLELSKLESNITPLNYEEYDLSEQIKEILSHFAILFTSKSITVKNLVPDSLICYAQKDKIETVINNYISNAVSHCSGEKIISISASTDKGKIRVNIFNTGEHIPDKDIDEIWHSFYRGDKARNRSENRFGLGLSIVKAIISNHGTTCGVSNKDGGVEFYFEVQEFSNE